MRELSLRLRRSWRALATAQRSAAGASLCLIVATALPWYHRSQRGTTRGAVLNGFASEPLLAAAIVLVAAFVIATLLIRGAGRVFHLPGGDARVITAAGVWTSALVVGAMVRGPAVSGVASQDTSQTLWWGVVVALVTSLALVVSGWRMQRSVRARAAA